MKRRTLKKLIRYACGDVAAECIFSRNMIPGVDNKKLDQAVIDVAALQEASLRLLSVSFDKTPKDFASKKEYNTAKYLYHSQAAKAFYTHFNKQMLAIVKEMNEALPERKQNDA